MKVINVKQHLANEYNKDSRIDLFLDNGDSIAVFVREDGKIELCASNPNKHGDFVPNKGTIVIVDHFGYPSD